MSNGVRTMPATKKIKVDPIPCCYCRTPHPPTDLVKSQRGLLYCVECNKAREARNGLAVQRIKMVRVKPKKIKVKTGGCVVCEVRFPIDDLYKCEDTFQLYCKDHAPGQRKKRIEKVDGFGWYVLAVEPGKEGIVKKNLQRKLRIEGKLNLLKRCIIAREFTDMIVPVRGDQVEEVGGFATRLDAIHVAKAKCQQIFHKTGVEHRYSAFPDKSEEGKHKEANTWRYRISTIPTDKELRTVGVKRYPGYLICQLEFCPEFSRILAKVSMQWGLLMPPVHQNFLISVSYSKRYDKWKWMVKRDGKTTVTKSTPFQMKATREEARTAAEEAKAKAMEFTPVRLSSEEEAREMLNQKIFNQLNTVDKESRDKAIINFRVGSEVEIVHGPFTGTKTKVEKINREDKINVTAWVGIPILGHPVPHEVPYWHLKVTSY